MDGELVHRAPGPPPEPIPAPDGRLTITTVPAGASTCSSPNRAPRAPTRPRSPSTSAATERSSESRSSLSATRAARRSAAFGFSGFGTAGRNTIPGPGLWSVNLSLSLSTTAEITVTGDAMTVVTWGAMVERCEQAAAQSHVDAEVLDLRTLSPLDLGSPQDWMLPR